DRVVGVEGGGDGGGGGGGGRGGRGGGGRGRRRGALCLTHARAGRIDDDRQLPAGPFQPRHVLIGERLPRGRDDDQAADGRVAGEQRQAQHRAHLVPLVDERPHVAGLCGVLAQVDTAT